jgi:hypothetical protein
MLLPKQKQKWKESTLKGPEPSPSLVGLLTVLILLLFAVYVCIFHAALQYKAPNEAVLIHVPQLRPVSKKEPVEGHFSSHDKVWKKAFLQQIQKRLRKST